MYMMPNSTTHGASGGENPKSADVRVRDLLNSPCVGQQFVLDTLHLIERRIARDRVRFFLEADDLLSRVLLRIPPDPLSPSRLRFLRNLAIKRSITDAVRWHSAVARGGRARKVPLTDDVTVVRRLRRQKP